MTNTQLQNLRQQLLALRNRLGTDISDLADEALAKAGAETNLSHLPIHMADLGTETFEQQLTLSLVENNEQLLEEVAAALERIEQGTFGRCEKCHRTIPHARLEALPYARYCIACARELQAGANER